MTTSVQGSASSIGMAPAGGGAAAPGGGLQLPSLTQQVTGGGDTAPATGQTAMPTAGTAPAAAATTPGAADPAAAATPSFDINSLASQGRWLGPLMAIGGGIAAIASFAKGQDGSKFLRYGGITSALGGLALTGVGFKAKGIEVGTKATEATAVQAINQLAQQSEQQLQAMATEANSTITALQQQLALAQQGVGAGQTQAQGQQGIGADPNAAGAGTGTGTDPANPTAGMDMGSSMSSGPVGPGIDAAVVPTNDAYAGVQATPSASGWTIQSLVGTSVQLAPGTSPSGTVIAEGGAFRIEQPAGDPNGYATLQEANAAARQSVSTELSGSRYMRWLVVEHEGRFYGAIAKQQQPGQQSTPLTAQLGNVVAWSALNHVTEAGGTSGFQAYSWNATEGAQSMQVPYGTTNVFPSGIGAPTAPATAAPAGTAPAVTGGGQTAATTAPATATTAFAPASQIGRSFTINAAVTPEGDVVRGGDLQIQKLHELSAGGFGTPEEAATVARMARAQAGEQNAWSRLVTLQGGDGRFYLYEGSIVARATAPLQNAAPMHVFSAGAAEYFDGATSSWKAIRDAG